MYDPIFLLCFYPTQISLFVSSSSFWVSGASAPSHLDARIVPPFYWWVLDFNIPPPSTSNTKQKREQSTFLSDQMETRSRSPLNNLVAIFLLPSAVARLTGTDADASALLFSLPLGWNFSQTRSSPSFGWKSASSTRDVFFFSFCVYISLPPLAASSFWAVPFLRS